MKLNAAGVREVEANPAGQGVQNKGLDVMFGRNVPSGHGTQALPFSISPGGQTRPVSIGMTGTSVANVRGRATRMRMMTLRSMMTNMNLSADGLIVMVLVD